METGPVQTPGCPTPILFGMRAANRRRRIIAGTKELRELRPISSIARSLMKANAMSSSSASNIRRLSTIVFEGAAHAIVRTWFKPQEVRDTLCARTPSKQNRIPHRYGGRDRA